MRRIGSLKLLSPSLRQKISKRMPLALAGIGAAGVIGTGVTSAMAAVKAFKHLEREHLVTGSKWEQFKATWRYFMLPTGVSLATIASILSGALLSHKHEASILASYGLLKAGYDEYRKQAKALLGDKMEENLHKSVEYTVAENPADTSKTEERLFYLDLGIDRDPNGGLVGKYFNAEMVEVIDAFYRLNYLMAQRGSVSVNTLLELLGLVTTMDGEVYGWVASDKMYNAQGFCWIDFNLDLIETDDGLECYAISFEPGSIPIKNYLD